MPAGIKPPQCVGKKGRSGRKNFKDEQAKNEAIRKSWEKVNKSLDKSEVSRVVEKVALPISLKDMGVKIKGDRDNPLLLQITGMEIKNDN